MERPGLNYLCAGFKHFFHHADYAMQIMAGLIGRGRPAAEVMPILAAEASKWAAAFARTGRNDPCPCGSGRKFKQCHGQPGSGPDKNPPCDQRLTTGRRRVRTLRHGINDENLAEKNLVG